MREPEQVVTRLDAARFVESMIEDLRLRPDDWENPVLEMFLDALAASLQDRETWPEQPVWRLLAEALAMARRYE
ncbi:DUF7660 family protein [Actinoplanes sp. G11-F43]|uniref:DUF7660 family protein n=1 Tax=Actinoplanes sp. G11-F43 TaxID=3424130 RepID=UPI003D32EDAF